MLPHLFTFFFYSLFSAHAVVDGFEGQYITDSNAWMVRQVTVKLVTTFDDAIYNCSGVQIGPNQILTAGHCLTKKLLEASYYGKMTVEVYDPKAPGRTRRVKVKGGFSEDTPNGDIAIVQTVADLPSRMLIPLVDGPCDPGTEYLAAGFGVTEGNTTSETLRLADLNPAPASISTLVNDHFKFLPKRIVLESKSGRPCQGDSGGPVFCRKRGHLVVAGVYGSRTYSRDPTSSNQKSELCREKGLFVVTSVAAKRDAIKKWQGSLNPPKTRSPGAAGS